MQATFPENADDEEAKPILYPLSNEGTEHTELPGEKSEWKDNELFIRRTFAESPSQGCALLFRRYHKILCSHAVRFVYSKEIAEDLVSEYFAGFGKRKRTKPSRLRTVFICSEVCEMRRLITCDGNLKKPKLLSWLNTANRRAANNPTMPRSTKKCLEKWKNWLKLCLLNAKKCFC